MAGDKHSITLPIFREAPTKSPENARAIVTQWSERFEKILTDRDLSGLSAVFREDAWVRDFLALSWDFRTIHCLTKIATYFGENLNSSGLRNVCPRIKGSFQPEFKNPAPGVHWVESMFDFQTNLGRGKGVVRLVVDSDDEWKCFVINFRLEELKGFEEKTGINRPHGYVDPRHGTWGERRQRQREFLDEDPYVFVIGAGQSGLDIGVRLQQLEIPTLIIDRHERVGDSWRKRYRTLMTHDPIQYCHLPFIPFPANWPMFMPKDKLADWLEAYATMMELNVWTSTVVETAEFDDNTKAWTIVVRRSDGSKRTIRPHHVVLATGHSGDPITPLIHGMGRFKGTVYHGSQHQDASLSGDLTNKKIVVVGSGNSGHDICQNFYEGGAAQVTMVQRGSTYVLTTASLPVLHHGMYEEDGPPTEDADVVGHSMPIPVQFALDIHTTEKITSAEREQLDGLAKAGFKVDFAPDGSGLLRKYITRGGGYYIDVGCSKLIIDGKVKVQHTPNGIKEFVSDGLVLANGTKLDADIVVLATGYDNMRSSLRKIMGDKVANRAQDVWDLNDEGEVNSIWRYSGHPGFWYMGGNLALCRSYSKLLALQIKALKENFYSQV